MVEAGCVQGKARWIVQVVRRTAVHALALAIQEPQVDRPAGQVRRGHATLRWGAELINNAPQLRLRPVRVLLPELFLDREVHAPLDITRTPPLNNSKPVSGW